MITACIIVLSVAAVAGFIACFHTFGLTFITVLLPPGAVTFLRRCGSMIVPPFATPAATSAIWSGVTSSLSWPNARRPGSIWPASSNSRRPPCSKRYSPLASTLADGSSIGGLE